MLRRVLWVLLALVLIVVALGAGALALLVWSPGTLKPAIERVASAQLGQKVTITGPIRVDPGRITTVEVEGLEVAAPEWADAQNLAEVQRLKVGLDLGSLFGGRSLHLTQLEVAAPRIALERDAQGRTTAATDSILLTGTAPAETSTITPTASRQVTASPTRTVRATVTAVSAANGSAPGRAYAPRMRPWRSTTAIAIVFSPMDCAAAAMTAVTSLAVSGISAACDCSGGELPPIPKTSSSVEPSKDA